MPLSGSEPFVKRAPEDVWWRQEEIVCEIVCGSEPVEARVVIGMCFLTLTELELMLGPPTVIPLCHFPFLLPPPSSPIAFAHSLDSFRVVGLLYTNPQPTPCFPAGDSNAVHLVPPPPRFLYFAYSHLHPVLAPPRTCPLRSPSVV